MNVEQVISPVIPTYLSNPIVFRDAQLGIAMVAHWNGEQWIFRVHSGHWCSVRKADVFDPSLIEPLNKDFAAVGKSTTHKTIPIQVWADVDEGIAPLVKYLNTIPGIRTHASCQGTIGEGGVEPYGPQVMVSYQTEDAEARLRKEFDCVEVAQNTVYVRQRGGSA
jgi:hypothetical protein